MWTLLCIGVSYSGAAALRVLVASDTVLEYVPTIVTAASPRLCPRTRSSLYPMA